MMKAKHWCFLGMVGRVCDKDVYFPYILSVADEIGWQWKMKHNAFLPIIHCLRPPLPDKTGMPLSFLLPPLPYLLKVFSRFTDLFSCAFNNPFVYSKALPISLMLVILCSAFPVLPFSWAPGTYFLLLARIFFWISLTPHWSNIQLVFSESSRFTELKKWSMWSSLSRREGLD